MYGPNLKELVMARLHLAELNEALEEIQEHKDAVQFRSDLEEAYYENGLDTANKEYEEYLRSEERRANTERWLHPHRNHIGVGR